MNHPNLQLELARTSLPASLYSKAALTYGEGGGSFLHLHLCCCLEGWKISDWGCVAIRSRVSGFEIHPVSRCRGARCCPFCANQPCRADGVYFSEALSAPVFTWKWLIWTTTTNLPPPVFVSRRDSKCSRIWASLLIPFCRCVCLWHGVSPGTHSTLPHFLLQPPQSDCRHE